MSYRQFPYTPTESIADRYRLLKTVMRCSGIFNLFYFTASHCFFRQEILQAPEWPCPDIESPFVISQSQLIGTLVLVYSLLNLIIANGPPHNRILMALNLGIGLICIVILIGCIYIGSLPAPILMTGVLLFVQVVLMICLLPWISAGRACSNRALDIDLNLDTSNI